MRGIRDDEIGSVVQLVCTLEREFNNKAKERMCCNSMHGYREHRLPKGIRRVIVFDTNAYRQLTHNLSLNEARAKSLHLRVLEHAAGNCALVCPVVIWELTAHLSDTNDPGYAHCMNAMLALAEHTWTPFDSGEGVWMIADSESTICHVLFQEVPLNALENTRNLCALAAYIKDNAPDISNIALNNIRSFSSHKEKIENQWIQDMRMVMNVCDPKAAKVFFDGDDDRVVLNKLREYFNSDSFMTSWASTIVQRHAELILRPLTEDEIADRSRFVLDTFPTPFHLLRTLLLKISNSPSINLDSSKKKRKNFIWDSSIAFTIGAQHSIEEAEVYLVTGDKEIKEASASARCDDRVISLDEYLKSLGM